MPVAKTMLFGSGAGGDTPPDPAETGAAEPSGRKCRSCGQQFSGSETRFCPFDGEPLEAADWDPSEDALVGSVVDNRYEVLAVLGEGGMGTVYRVRHKALERPLALKALRRDLSKDADLPVRFIQEAKAAAAVEHPNVVQITDFGTLSTGQPYFVMELLEGESLSTLIRESGRLTPSRAVAISVQVAEALGAAHAAGIVHRDLKPDNVNVRRLGHHDVVKVLDFGLAKVAGTSRLTRAGMVFGTPHYMSPEQAGGEPSDHRVDIYALGVMLFEMLTGKLPFEAESFTGVLAMHMYMEPPSPSAIVGVPLGAVEDVVKKCMAKKPAERYATMGDVLTDLDRVGSLLSVPPEPSSRRRLEEATTGELVMSVERRPGRLGGRLPWVVAGAVVVFAVGVVGLLGLRDDGASSDAPKMAATSAAPSPSVAPPAAAPGSAAQVDDPEPVGSTGAEASSAPAARPAPKALGAPAVKPTGTGGNPKPGRPSSGEIIDPWGR
ncbi:MAG: serine/threonine protein kinase [Myxococcales bacterium]|nr:serine/threonine protein kinase [Myxococcales bacterium]